MGSDELWTRLFKLALDHRRGEHRHRYFHVDGGMEARPNKTLDLDRHLLFVRRGDGHPVPIDHDSARQSVERARAVEQSLGAHDHVSRIRIRYFGVPLSWIHEIDSGRDRRSGHHRRMFDMGAVLADRVPALETNHGDDRHLEQPLDLERFSVTFTCPPRHRAADDSARDVLFLRTIYKAMGFGTRWFSPWDRSAPSILFRYAKAYHQRDYERLDQITLPKGSPPSATRGRIFFEKAVDIRLNIYNNWVNSIVNDIERTSTQKT